MRKRFSKSIIDSTVRSGLCLAFVAGMCSLPMVAQDDVTSTEEETEAPVRRVAKKPQKTYPMKAVSGRVTDGATGQPMGGVRIQALQLPQYSALTEEDGTYTLEVPTFCDVLVFDAPDYNLVQQPIKGSEG